MSGVCAVCVLRLAAVLEQSSDQLSVLGHVMGAVEKASSSSLNKLNRDRQCVLQLFSSLQSELQQQQSFCSLLQAVEEEERRKAGRLDVIVREEEGGRSIRALQRQSLDLQQGTTVKLQERQHLTALLQQQQQRLQAASRRQQRYERSGAELQLLQTHKLSQQAEGTLQDRIQLLQDRLEEERRVHEETQNFLSQQQMLLQQQLQQLAERSERLLEEKQQELNSLRSNKTSNLDLLQDLSRKFREAEQLVMEDRKEKEKLRRQQEREQTERSAVTTLQAWWRGCLVRRGLASCKTGKKTKEGKKKGKKKK